MIKKLISDEKQKEKPSYSNKKLGEQVCQDLRQESDPVRRSRNANHGLVIKIENKKRRKI